MRTPLAVSLTTHLALIFALQPAKAKGPQAPIRITVAESERLGPNEEKQVAERKSGGVGETDCKDGYEGIGIHLNWNGIVVNAPAGNPAYKAGIRVGDDFGPGDPTRHRGPAGTTITVEALRGGKKMVFRVTRAKICVL